MHVNAELADTQVRPTEKGPSRSPRRRRFRRVAAVTGTAAMAVALGACYGPIASGSSSIAVSCTSFDSSQNVTGTFDAQIDVGLSAPSWTGDGDQIPFRDATLSGVGTPEDPTILSFAIDGASPSNLYFARNAADNGFDDVQTRTVTAPVGGNVTANFANVLVIHVNGEDVSYDLCLPAAGEDTAVITLPVRANPATTTTTTTTPE
jgi:hypothetical protein